MQKIQKKMSMSLSRLIVPSVTFLTTYFESIQGIFAFVPNYIERPFQAFMGAFLSGLAVNVLSGVNINTDILKDLARLGAAAAVGCMVGGVVGGILNLDNPALFAAIGASAVVYSIQ